MILFLDLETGGTDETKSPILQIGACWYDQPGTFFRRVGPSSSFDLIEPDAMRVNGEDERSIEDPKRTPDWLALGEFLGWVKARCGDVPRRVTLAGWNVHFDHRFLLALMREMKLTEDTSPFRHTLLDLHSLTLAKQIERRSFAQDSALFGSDLVRSADHASQILDIAPEAKPHHALAGALHAREIARALGLKFVFGGVETPLVNDEPPAQPPKATRGKK